MYVFIVYIYTYISIDELTEKYHIRNLILVYLLNLHSIYVHYICVFIYIYIYIYIAYIHLYAWRYIYISYISMYLLHLLKLHIILHKYHIYIIIIYILYR